MKTRLAILFALAFFTLAPPALAVNPSPIVNQNPSPIVNPSTGSNTTLINPLKGVDCSGSNGDCLMAFLNSILDFVIQIGTIAVILMLVYIGFLYVKALGKPAEISAAHKALLWTVVGALILLGAKAISVGIMATVKALSAGN